MSASPEGTYNEALIDTTVEGVNILSQYEMESFQDYIESFLQENEQARMLLKASDVDSKTKDALLTELAHIKVEMLQVKERFVGVISHTEALELSGPVEELEKNQNEIICKEKKKYIDSVLGLVREEYQENFLSTWKKEQENLDTYKLAYTEDFPLLDAVSIEMLNFAAQSIEKQKSGDIEYLFTLTKFLYRLYTQGVSVEMCQSVDCLLSDKYLVEQAVKEGASQHISAEADILRVLDTTDFVKQSVRTKYRHIHNFTPDVLDTITGKRGLDFTWKDSLHTNTYDLRDACTQESVDAFKIFAPDVKEVSVATFVFFAEHVEKLPKEIQVLCAEEFKKDASTFPANYINQDVLYTLNGAEHVAAFIRLKNRGLMSLRSQNLMGPGNSARFEAYKNIQDITFDRCAEVAIPFKDLDVVEIVDRMTNDEFELYKEVCSMFKGDTSNLVRSFARIMEYLSIDGAKSFIVWIKKTSDDASTQWSFFNSYTSDVNLQRFAEIFEGFCKEEKDIDVVAYISSAYGSKKMQKILDRQTGQNSELEHIVSLFNEKPEEIVLDIIEHIDGLTSVCTNFDEVRAMLARKNIHIHEDLIEHMFLEILKRKPLLFLEKTSFPVTVKQREQIVDVLIQQHPVEVLKRYATFKEDYVAYCDDVESAHDKLFHAVLGTDALVLLETHDFPLKDEQLRYLDVLKKIKESPSRELSNLGREIAGLIVQYTNTEEAYKALEKIEQIFLSNNIPLVGKQYKVFEILYPNERLTAAVDAGKISSLKEISNSHERRLVIFKDLMRAHMASADTNLEQYLLALKDGKDVLAKFESGASLDDTEKDVLIMCLKKINIISGHVGRKRVAMPVHMSDTDIADAIARLSETFGVRQGENIIGKFERTFLKRIGIDSIEDALDSIQKNKDEATERNERESTGEGLYLEDGDLAKNVSSNYFEDYLHRGVYAPEFIGAESSASVDKSKQSDWTPLDTDVFRITTEKRLSYVEAAKSNFTDSTYGDVVFIMKQKEQFKKDGLDVFKTGVVRDAHFGIRTGFGSTQIDAIILPSYLQEDPKYKYMIAKAGFYIPIYTTEGTVSFTKEDFDRYRKIFQGIDRFHGGPVDIVDIWKKDKHISEIETCTQTDANMEQIISVRDTVMSRIKEVLETEGISLHKGKYDDSLRGATISDTGSTGRGSSLDEKLDFDFVIKLDTDQWDKVSRLTLKLSELFPKVDEYIDNSMVMFRSGDVTIDGVSMTIDVGFNTKTNSEEFDAHDALKEKYASIELTYGRQAYLDVLTNVRFAKEKLKKAGCYKKGLGNKGQQGGLGGIGVEYWILQHGGDAVHAFTKFKEHAFEGEELVPFEEFKKRYQVFSAGQNIRGSVRVENFIYNMAEAGYEKMAMLAREFAAD